MLYLLLDMILSQNNSACYAVVALENGYHISEKNDGGETGIRTPEGR